MKSRFLSYRLNLPSRDESEMLLTVDDWAIAEGREVQPRADKPIVAVDLGGGRSWSAAVAVWQSGRIEAMAVAPGIPSLEDQEKRDSVPAGMYQRLYDAGILDVAEGLRVQKPEQLWDAIIERWGIPVRLVCDRFRLGDLLDCVGGACVMEPRVTRWSDAAADIRALRKIFRDGPASIEATVRPLLMASLSAAYVKGDDQGNTRLTKRGKDNKARDDVAAALTLAAGAFARAGEAPARELSYTVV